MVQLVSPMPSLPIETGQGVLIRSYLPDRGPLSYPVILYAMRSLSGPWMNDFDERYLKYHILSRKGIVEIDCYHGISGIKKPHVSWAAI